MCERDHARRSPTIPRHCSPRCRSQAPRFSRGIPGRRASRQVPRADRRDRRAVRAAATTGDGPILVVGGENDPATPFRWAEEMTAALGDEAVLVTYTGEGHGQLLGSRVRHRAGGRHTVRRRGARRPRDLRSRSADREARLVGRAAGARRGLRRREHPCPHRGTRAHPVDGLLGAATHRPLRRGSAGCAIGGTRGRRLPLPRRTGGTPRRRVTGLHPVGVRHRADRPHAATRGVRERGVGETWPTSSPRARRSRAVAAVEF